MANVTVNGSNYTGVSEVRLPITGSSEKQRFVLPPIGTKEITQNGIHDVSGYASAAVDIPSNEPETQEKTVTPTKSGVVVTPDSGKLLSKVTVSGDNDLVEGNIRSGVNIFGVTGSYSGASAVYQTKTVTPTTSQQTVNADAGYDALSSVTVNAIQTETKQVTPSETVQNIPPTSGKFISRVEVGAISSTYVGSGVTRKQAQTYTPGTASQTIAASQYLEGVQTILGDTNLIADNIRSGAQIFGVVGTFVGSGSGGTPFEVSGNPITCEPVAGSTLNVTAMVQPTTRLDWVKQEGTTVQNGTPTPSAPVAFSYSIPAGSYYVPSTAPEGGYWKIVLLEALAGRGDYKDTIEIDAYTGFARKIKKTNIKTLTGSENWKLFNHNSGRMFTLTDNTLGAPNPPTYVANGNSLATHCPYSVGYQTYNTGIFISDGKGINVAAGLGNNYADVNAWKSFLSAQNATGTPFKVLYPLSDPVITTFQAVHVNSTSGLTALNAIPMGLTEADADHPGATILPSSVTVTHNGVQHTTNVPEGFTGGAVIVSGIVAMTGENTLSVNVGYLVVSGVASSGGGVTVQSATGTFTAPGYGERSIACGFVPDLVVIGLPEGYAEGNTSYPNDLIFSFSGVSGRRVGVTLVGNTSTNYNMYGGYCQTTSDGFALSYTYWQDFNGDYDYDATYTLTYRAIKFTE